MQRQGGRTWPRPCSDLILVCRVARGFHQRELVGGRGGVMTQVRCKARAITPLLAQRHRCVSHFCFKERRDGVMAHVSCEGVM
jgi:hypothetical protein